MYLLSVCVRVVCIGVVCLFCIVYSLINWSVSVFVSCLICVVFLLVRVRWWGCWWCGVE